MSLPPVGLALCDIDSLSFVKYQLLISFALIKRYKHCYKISAAI